MTIGYSGTIVYSTIPSILIGDAFSGTLTYQNPEAPTTSADTWWMGLGDEITLSVDGYNFSYSATLFDSQLGVAISPLQDVFSANADSGGSGFASNLPGVAVTQMDAQFRWPSGTLAPGVLPDPFDPAGLQFGPIIGADTGADMFLTDGTGIEGLMDRVEVVPEPAAGGLVIGGLALMAALCLLRSRRNHGPFFREQTGTAL